VPATSSTPIAARSRVADSRRARLAPGARRRRTDPATGRPISRAASSSPHGQAEELEIWIDRKYVPAGYGWSFPLTTRCGSGSARSDPRFHVKETTVQLTQDLGPNLTGIRQLDPHKLRDATEDGIFFVGDSAGHCLPLTAEGIRTALYFGIACGRELAEVIAGRQSKESALARYGAFSAKHTFAFESLLRVQRLVPRCRRVCWADPARDRRQTLCRTGRSTTT